MLPTTWTNLPGDLAGPDNVIVAIGEHPTDTGWLLDLLAYVSRWPEPATLCFLCAEGKHPTVVRLYLEGGFVQAVIQSENRGSGRLIRNRLGALDACAQFAGPASENACEDTRFRYVVLTGPRPKVAVKDADLRWTLTSFSLSLVSLCDVLRDEAPALQGMGVDMMKRYRFNEQATALVAEGRGTQEEEDFLAVVTKHLAAAGSGMDVRSAAVLTGTRQRTAAALLMRLWRSGLLVSLRSDAGSHGAAMSTGNIGTPIPTPAVVPTKQRSFLPVGVVQVQPRARPPEEKKSGW